MSDNTPIRYLPGPKVWVLETGRTSYAIGINDRNEIQHLYWGNRLVRDEDYPPARAGQREGTTNEEYPAWGGMRYMEPCLKITLDDGVRDTVLKYEAHELEGEHLRIRLKDISYDLYVTLVYRVYPAHDVVRKQAVIENRTGQRVVLESAQSGVWHVPPGDGYRLSYLAGRWGAETQLIREPVQQGSKVLESRRGITSHQANPWFALDFQGRAGEEHGPVWFGGLGWSGNWKLAVEQTPHQQVRVVGGYNTFDFAYLLQPGQILETPPFYAGFTDQGFGEASRMLHRFQLDKILPRSSTARPRPVLYNSWYATTFNVDVESQKRLAEKAARLGVELFMMDDGWFGARDHDRAGLGDWFPSPKKFPNGLGPLIEHVNRLGMDFALWVEPEMVNPDSELYRRHPDWVLHFPGRPRTEGRNQLVLNMARDDVKEHIFGVLDRLVTENNIRMFKWDMNRSFSEPGWPDVSPAEQRNLWVKYVTNVYEIMDRLREKHPGLEIESCAGGGGRVDLGILERVEQVWTSDNVEAFDRLFIQDGFAHAYTPKVMMNWVTDVPSMNRRSTPLKYRFLVAMTGSLGIGGDLNRWSEEDFDLAGSLVAYYKRVRDTVQQGKLYRLSRPDEGEQTATQYVSEDRRHSALFVFLRSQRFLNPAPVVYLRGLEANAVYRIETIDDKLRPRIENASGAFLMNKGLTFNLTGDFDSSSIRLERAD